MITSPTSSLRPTSPSDVKNTVTSATLDTINSFRDFSNHTFHALADISSVATHAGFSAVKHGADQVYKNRDSIEKVGSTALLAATYSTCVAALPVGVSILFDPLTQFLDDHFDQYDLVADRAEVAEVRSRLFIECSLASMAFIRMTQLYFQKSLAELQRDIHQAIGDEVPDVAQHPNLPTAFLLNA